MLADGTEVGESALSLLLSWPLGTTTGLAAITELGGRGLARLTVVHTCHTFSYLSQQSCKVDFAMIPLCRIRKLKHREA